MTRSAPVVCCAPGAGLGHLVRALSICSRLDELGIGSLVLTNSPFSPGLSRITHVPIVHIRDSSWKREARAAVEQLGPRALLVDTFALGLRGEWLDGFPQKLEVIHLVRRLRLDCYLDALSASRKNLYSGPCHAIALEPLLPEQEDALQACRVTAARLPGRIHAAALPPALPIPDEIQRDHKERPLWLVTHSGPAEETEELVTKAKRQMRETGAGANLKIVSPFAPGRHRSAWLEFFPARSLYHKAERVFTGGGYNSVADRDAWPEKIVAHAFSRRYDDQEGRVRQGAMPGVDGGPAAAREVARILK